MNLTHAFIADFAALQALRPQWHALSARIAENTDFFATWEATWAYPPPL
jgi:hypothetical protein